MPTKTSLYSTMIRSGRKTYFVDVREAKNGSKFISISENRINGEDRKRVTIRVFGENVSEFLRSIEDAVAFLGPIAAEQDIPGESSHAPPDALPRL